MDFEYFNSYVKKKNIVKKVKEYLNLALQPRNLKKVIKKLAMHLGYIAYRGEIVKNW